MDGMVNVEGFNTNLIKIVPIHTLKSLGNLSQDPFSTSVVRGGATVCGGVALFHRPLAD